MSQQINLYNPLFRRQKQLFSASNMLLAGLVLAVGVLALYAYAWTVSHRIDQRAQDVAEQNRKAQADLVKATAQFGPRQPSKLLQEEVARMEQQSAAREQIVKLMGRGELGNTTGFSPYLLALARQTRAGVWITGLRVVGKASDLAIRGRALQPELVPLFIEQLKKEPILAGQTFSTLD
ncbi:MAG: PilN domain-containing protein, partial [Pseudomonadota bacterium]|nr:PilN domain-containing protein [Pseudomonadota bacterium]